MHEEHDPAEAFRAVFAPREPRTFSPIQVAAVIVFVLTIVVPVGWFVDANFHGLFGNPKLVLCAILSAGGAIGLSLVVGKGRRCISFFPGSLMGAGMAGMVILANTHCRDLVHFPHLGKVVLIFAMLFGAFPGMFTWLRLTRRTTKDSRDD
jgi:hypothetical protein